MAYYCTGRQFMSELPSSYANDIQEFTLTTVTDRVACYMPQSERRTGLVSGLDYFVVVLEV